MSRGRFHLRLANRGQQTRLGIIAHHGQPKQAPIAHCRTRCVPLPAGPAISTIWTSTPTLVSMQLSGFIESVNKVSVLVPYLALFGIVAVVVANPWKRD